MVRPTGRSSASSGMTASEWKPSRFGSKPLNRRFRSPVVELGDGLDEDRPRLLEHCREQRFAPRDSTPSGPVQPNRLRQPRVALFVVGERPQTRRAAADRPAAGAARPRRRRRCSRATSSSWPARPVSRGCRRATRSLLGVAADGGGPSPDRACLTFSSSSASARLWACCSCWVRVLSSSAKPALIVCASSASSSFPPTAIGASLALCPA